MYKVRRVRGSVEVRFWRKVEITDACWLWLASTLRGYPRFYDPARIADGHGRDVYAHRWSYEHFVGPIPEGYEVDHLCKVTRCVRPDHLEAVPPRENNHRSDSPVGINYRKTHCPNGHAYAEHGYIYPSTDKRRCKTCSNAYNREYFRGFRGSVTGLPDGAIR